MRNGEVGMGKSEWGKLKKQLCVRLEVGGLRQKAKSPSNLINLINSINLINYLRLEPYALCLEPFLSSIEHRVSSIEYRVSRNQVPVARYPQPSKQDELWISY
jgi:hypothetical protein